MIKLSEPQDWLSTELVRNDVIASMDIWGQKAKNITSKEDLVSTFGGTLTRYTFYNELIKSSDILLRAFGKCIFGIVLDLGSGTGVGASIISGFKTVQKVYAIEYSKSHVDNIMPYTFEYFPSRVEKIQRVVGDFNNLELDDESVDSIIEIGAFHHSENLETTLNESFRVLKPGGVLLGLDRTQPNHIPRQNLEEMLDIELKPEQKIRYGIPIEQSFTRRDWGEHEYHASDWLSNFKNAGFDPAIIQWKRFKFEKLNSIFHRGKLYRFNLIFSRLFYTFGKRSFHLSGPFGHQHSIIFAFKPK